MLQIAHPVPELLGVGPDKLITGPNFSPDEAGPLLYRQITPHRGQKTHQETSLGAGQDQSIAPVRSIGVNCRWTAGGTTPGRSCSILWSIHHMGP